MSLSTLLIGVSGLVLLLTMEEAYGDVVMLQPKYQPPPSIEGTSANYSPRDNFPRRLRENLPMQKLPFELIAYPERISRAVASGEDDAIQSPQNYVLLPSSLYRQQRQHPCSGTQHPVGTPCGCGLFLCDCLTRDVQRPPTFRSLDYAM